MYVKSLKRLRCPKTSATKVVLVLVSQWGICSAPSLHENVAFSVCACLGIAAYIISITLNSISGLDAWYNFRFNISCGVADTVRGRQKTKSGNF